MKLAILEELGKKVTSISCDLGIVKDELYFVFHYPLYTKPRHSFFEKTLLKNADLFWLPEHDVWLFKMEPFALAKVIENA